MHKTIWRIAAIIITLVWIIVLITNNYLRELEDAVIRERIHDNIFYAVPTILSLFLVFFPTKFVLYAIMCCFLGVENIVEGVGAVGFLMYLLGCIFAFRSGINYKKRSIIFLFALIPIIALASQYRLGLIVLYESALELLFLCVFFSLTYVLLKDYVIVLKKTDVVEDIPNNTQEPIDISLLSLVEQGLLNDILEDTKFSAIADKHNKSESAIKHDMVALYHKLGVESKKELLALCNKKEILTHSNRV